ncbi:MAG: hypothetical protein WBV39_15920 [Rudaea sp.]
MLELALFSVIFVGQNQTVCKKSAFLAVPMYKLLNVDIVGEDCGLFGQERLELALINSGLLTRGMPQRSDSRAASARKPIL